MVWVTVTLKCHCNANNCCPQLAQVITVAALNVVQVKAWLENHSASALTVHGVCEAAATCPHKCQVELPSQLVAGQPPNWHLCLTMLAALQVLSYINHMATCNLAQSLLSGVAQVQLSMH